MKGKRLVAMVLAVVVALGSVCWKPPKAQAVFTEPAVALGCALLTSVIVGTTANLVFTDAVKENIGYAIDGLVTEYLDTVGDVAATTSDNFFSIIASGPKLLTTGAILLSKEAGELIARFVAWLQTEKGLEAGGESVNIGTPMGMIVYNGVQFPDINSVWTDKATFPYAYLGTGSSGTSYLYICSGNWYVDPSTNELFASGAHSYQWYRYDPAANAFVFVQGYEYTFSSHYGIVPFWASVDLYYYGSATNEICLSASDPVVELGDDAVLKPLQTLQTIPQEIPDSQSLVISGIDGISLDDQSTASDAIFDAVLAGTLAPSVTVEDVATDIPATDTDTDTSILSWVKKIWQSVTDIPAAIAEAVASIFVPSADFYPTAIASLKDAFSDRMGLLTYPISILFDFLDRMVNLSEQQPILRWGNIYLPGYATPLVAAGQYNLNDAIGTAAGKQLHDIYLVIVDAIMILAFVDLCRRKYQKIIDN